MSVYQNGDRSFNAPRGFGKDALIVGQNLRNILVLSYGILPENRRVEPRL